MLIVEKKKKFKPKLPCQKLEKKSIITQSKQKAGNSKDKSKNQWNWNQKLEKINGEKADS